MDRSSIASLRGRPSGGRRSRFGAFTMAIVLASSVLGLSGATAPARRRGGRLPDLRRQRRRRHQRQRDERQREPLPGEAARGPHQVAGLVPLQPGQERPDLVQLHHRRGDVERIQHAAGLPHDPAGRAELDHRQPHHGLLRQGQGPRLRGRDGLRRRRSWATRPSGRTSRTTTRRSCRRRGSWPRSGHSSSSRW